ncbi:trem-like transcript 2 protein isoform 5-T7 [Glossophaga mutica]
MAPTLLLLLFLLWLQGCVSGAPAESVYSKVQHFEGETLSVQCSYKSRKKHVEGKVWCKIRKKKCEPGFSRVWVQGPRYVLQDDAQAKVINISMVALRRQDSGRYWCMRNSSGTLYPLMGFQLEVFPVPATERNAPVTQLANILKGGIVVTTGRAPTSGSDAPFTTSMRMFTPGVLTLDRLLPPTASETIRLSSTAGYSFTSPSTPGPRRTKGLQTVTASPGNARASSAGPISISTKAGHLRTRSPTTRMCHTSRSLLNKLSPIRLQRVQGPCSTLEVPTWKTGASLEACLVQGHLWSRGASPRRTPGGCKRSEDEDLFGLEPDRASAPLAWKPCCRAEGRFLHLDSRSELLQETEGPPGSTEQRTAAQRKGDWHPPNLRVLFSPGREEPL